jgi:hypothetical protein
VVILYVVDMLLFILTNITSSALVLDNFIWFVGFTVRTQNEIHRYRGVDLRNSFFSFNLLHLR